MKVMLPDEAWEKFAKEKLLANGIINGLLLLTSNASTKLYSYGRLESLSQEQFSQFTKWFEESCHEDLHEENLRNGFALDLGGQKIKFVVRSAQYHSVYAISKRNLHGLVIVNLPYGVLVASHSYPCHSVDAARHVEDVCELLRA